MRSALLLLAALAAFAAFSVVAADDEFTAVYNASAPSDDPAVSGDLHLDLKDDDDDDDDDDECDIEFRAQLLNAAGVTGVHLHLYGNSSEGLYGGPLLLALTNTSAEPASPSAPGQPLIQEGCLPESRLLENPQLAAVQARFQELNLPGSPPRTSGELAALITSGAVEGGAFVYTDVHTTEKVSPQGLTRGRVVPRVGDDDDDNTATQSSDDGDGK